MKHIEKTTVLVNVAAIIVIIITIFFTYVVGFAPGTAISGYIVGLRIEEEYKQVIPKERLLQK